MGGVPGIKRKKKKSPVRARSDYTRAILMTVAAAGVLSMAVLAPNAIQILKPILENRHYDPTKYVRRKTASLVKAGLLEFGPDAPGRARAGAASLEAGVAKADQALGRPLARGHV